MVRTLHSGTKVWADQATALAQWTQRCLVNRSDLWQAWVAKSWWSNQIESREVRGLLSERRIIEHFAATNSTQLLAVHSSSLQQTTRWLAILVERQGKNDPVTPGVNFQAILIWFEMLESMGFRPILEDTDGAGGYRLLVPFNTPVSLDHIGRFSQEVVSGYANHGLQVPPRILPAPLGTTDYGRGNWLRLPGHHPTRNHYSRLWSGSHWLKCEETVDALLLATPSPAQFIRTSKPKVARIEPPI